MSTSRTFYLSTVEFRPDPARREGAMQLGLLLEFTTPLYWVVGLGVRAVVDPATLASLDALSRELIDNRSNLMSREIGDALQSASKPGDVLKALSQANLWSLHVTDPIALESEPKASSRDQSIEQALEEYIVTVYQRAIAAEKPAASSWISGFVRPPSRPLEPFPAQVEIPPPWMLPPRHWARPLVSR